MVTKNNATEEYREFRLEIQRYRQSGDWSGMAKGRGTVLLQRVFATADEAMADLRRRVDIYHDRSKGNHAGA